MSTLRSENQVEKTSPGAGVARDTTREYTVERSAREGIDIETEKLEKQ